MKEGREDLRHIPASAIDLDARLRRRGVRSRRRPTAATCCAYIAIDVSTYVTTGKRIDDEGEGAPVRRPYLPDRAITMLPRAYNRSLARSCRPWTSSVLPVGTPSSIAARSSPRGSCARSLVPGEADVRRRFQRAGLSDKEQARAGGERDGRRHRVAGARALEEPAGSPDEARGARFRAARGEGHPPRGRRGSRSTSRAGRRTRASRRPHQLVGEELTARRERDRRDLVQGHPDDLPGLRRRRRAEADQPRMYDRCRSTSTSRTTKDEEAGRLLKSFKDHRWLVLNSLLLRSMKQATYDIVNMGHFGLASKAYLHFPRRRSG